MIGISIVQKVQAVVQENAASILTGVGVAGTVTTAVLTGRATIKAIDILDHDYATRAQNKPAGEDLVVLTKFEKAQLVWPQYIPPVGVGGLTIASIIYANRISAKQAAAMAAAYTLSEKTLGEYKDKVTEKLGIKKAESLQDEVAQERIKDNPPAGAMIVIGEGDVLCYDALTGRYFKSSMDKLKKAENETNADIVTGDSASLSRFYDELDLPNTPFSETVGWNLDNRCDLQISAIVTEDDKPCLYVDFRDYPKADYIRSWGG